MTWWGKDLYLACWEMWALPFNAFSIRSLILMPTNSSIFLNSCFTEGSRVNALSTCVNFFPVVDICILNFLIHLWKTSLFPNTCWNATNPVKTIKNEQSFFLFVSSSVGLLPHHVYTPCPSPGSPPVLSSSFWKHLECSFFPLPTTL